MSRLALLHPALIATLALSAAACIVNPPAETAAATPQDTAAAKGEGKLICQRYDATASRVRKEKVCMTAEQWKAHSEDAEGYARSIQNSGSTQPGGESLTGR